MPRRRHPSIRLLDSRLSWAAAVAAIALGAGCARIPVSEQGRVGKPNMVFADTAVFAYDSGLVGQLEPGAAVSGGAQAAGCTSCK